MDEFDEQIYKTEEEIWRNAKESRHRYYSGPSHSNGIYMRLYEKEEQATWDIRKRVRTIRNPASGGAGVFQDDFLFTYYTPDRVRRFFHTVKGYHIGCLDLRGRHESRYQDIISRWKEFSKELCEIRQHDNQHEERMVDSNGKLISFDDGEFITYTRHDVNPPELLQSFCFKWHLLSSLVNLNSLYDLYEEVTSCLAQNPSPKFQRLSLQDLPVELIHHIMETSGDEECRQLGQCSKLLRDTSTSHIYRNWNIVLEISSERWRICGTLQSQDEKSQFMRDSIECACKKFSDKIATLRDCEDVLRRIRSFHSINLLDRADIHTDANITHEELLQLFVPLVRSIFEVISRARGVESLSINGFTLNADLVVSVLSLPQLHTVEMVKCALDVDSAARLPQCNAILNATFMLREANHSSTWRLLPFLIGLRWLSIVNVGDEFALPPPEIRVVTNSFATLERVHICYIQLDEIDNLIEWIRQAAPPNGPGLRLTHFKLELRCGINEDEVSGLLSALQGAPMEYFVLDGLTYAEPELFDWISHAFPNLQSLTIVYRDNRQYKGRDALWPHATWEYAPHFAGFNCLKHFGWNFKLEVCYPSPSIMLLFENNFQECWWDIAEQAGGEFDDWYCIPRLFYAHCPTLESFVFLVNGTVALLRYGLHSTRDTGLEIVEKNQVAANEHNPIHWIGWPKFTSQ